MSHSESLQFDPNDPRLTAYVLDELDANERSQVESLIEENPNARAAVDEIREAIDVLQSAFDIEVNSVPEYSELLNGAVIRPAAVSDKDAIHAETETAIRLQGRPTRWVVVALSGTALVASLFVAIIASDRFQPEKGFEIPAVEQGDVNSNGFESYSFDQSQGEGIRQLVLGDHYEALPLVSQDLLVKLKDRKSESQPTDDTTQLGAVVSDLQDQPGNSLVLDPAYTAKHEPTAVMRSMNRQVQQQGSDGNSLIQGSQSSDGNVVVQDGKSPSHKKVFTVPRQSGQPVSGPAAQVVGNSLVVDDRDPLQRKQEALKSVIDRSYRIVEGAVDGLAVRPSKSRSAGIPSYARPEGKRSSGPAGAGVPILNRRLGILSQSGNGNGSRQATQSWAAPRFYLEYREYKPDPNTDLSTIILPDSSGRSDIVEDELLTRVSPETSVVDMFTLESQAHESPTTGFRTGSKLGRDGTSERKEEFGQALPGLRFSYLPRLAEENAEAYEPIVENEFLAPTVAPLSTFAIDVDTASYSNVRRFLTQGQFPPPNAVRIEELLNYFQYDDPAPSGERPFSISMETARCPWNMGHQLVRIGLKGKEIHPAERPPSNLVFLVDVSGSMKNDNKLPLVKSGLELLVGEMTENDRIAIVTYARHAGVVLESTSGQNKTQILNAIRNLKAGGSTNGEGGLQLAYDQAVKNAISEGANRVILCTDGDFNVGVSNDDELVKIIGRHAETGVYLSIFGFGMGNLKDGKLEKLADKGNGHYGYVDGIREAQKVFVEEMTGTLYTIAKDVKVQVEFNPAKIGAYRLIGYENRMMPAQDFQNDAKDAGDIGAGHSVTALYELIPAGVPLPAKGLKYQSVPEVKAPVPANDSNELLTLSLRYKHPEPIAARRAGAYVPQKSVLEEYPLAAPTDANAEVSQDLRWASAVAAFGMILRDSAHKGQADLPMVLTLAASCLGAPEVTEAEQTEDSAAEISRRKEFVELVNAVRKLRGELPNDGDGPADEQSEIESRDGLNLGETAVKKGLGQNEAWEILKQEGFESDPDQPVLYGQERFRKRWEGGYHYVTLLFHGSETKSEGVTVTEVKEFWNDP
jgi:Ca-activated chloride channel homolog